MPKIELGRIGAVVDPGPGLADTAARLEALGYPTVWVPGGPLERLGQVVEAVRATKQTRVATGIIPVVRFTSEEVAALHTELEAEAPGRFVLGLGGAHGPRPFETLNAYLDRLDAVGIPAGGRVLAALGPRMLDLARERAAGAYPVLVTPAATASARERLGDDTTLAIDQLVVVEDDPGRARELARRPLGFLGTLPQYQAHFRRIGFGEDDIAGLSDRLVDAVVPWGDADTVAARVAEVLDAGADHVAINVQADTPDEALAGWEALAARLLR